MAGFMADCVCTVGFSLLCVSGKVTVLQSDNYWLGTRTPCLTYSPRGLSYYKITVSGPACDLHSGVFRSSRTNNKPDRAHGQTCRSL
jgi:hypothetical protein